MEGNGCVQKNRSLSGLFVPTCGQYLGCHFSSLSYFLIFLPVLCPQVTTWLCRCLSVFTGAVVFLSWECQYKAPQVHGSKQQKRIPVQFWSLEPQNQEVGGATLPLKALGEDPFPLPSLWKLPAIHGLPWLATPSHQPLPLSSLLLSSWTSLCVAVSFLQGNHWT